MIDSVDNSIFLSICIMTYNRVVLLQETLNSILANDLGSDIEIVISDNCSSDNTSEIINKYQNLNKRVSIRYFRNESNLGFDGNVIKSIERAKGKYTWMFSDDDIMPKGLFKYVESYLRKADYKIVYLAHHSFRHGDDLSSVYRTFLPEIDQEYSDGISFVDFCGLGFISSLIFQSSLAKINIKYAKSIYNNAHLEVAIRISVLNDGKCLFIGKRSIAARSPLNWNRKSFLNDGYINTLQVYKNAIDEDLLPNSYIIKRCKSIIWNNIPQFIFNAAYNNELKNILDDKKKLMDCFPLKAHKIIIWGSYRLAKYKFVVFLYGIIYRQILAKRLSNL